MTDPKWKNSYKAKFNFWEKSRVIATTLSTRYKDKMSFVPETPPKFDTKFTQSNIFISYIVHVQKRDQNIWKNSSKRQKNLKINDIVQKIFVDSRTGKL